MCYASNKHYLKLPAWITEGINTEEEHFEIHTSLYFMIWAWKYKVHANETHRQQTGEAISVSSRGKLVPFGSFSRELCWVRRVFSVVHSPYIRLPKRETVKVHLHGLWHQQDKVTLRKKPAGTYLLKKRRCSKSAGKTSSGPLHVTIIAPSVIRETLTLNRSLLAPSRESRDHTQEKKVNLFILDTIQQKRLAQPATRKGRSSKGVNKVGSFSLNKYLAESR